ncbi:MAG: hypothetical protein OEY14_01560 [Myxococcales bacterium]|nr:hypothetical protein [Myxococcales bacterium]
MQLTVGEQDRVIVLRERALLHEFGPGARALPNDCGVDCALFFVFCGELTLPLEGTIAGPSASGGGGDPVIVKGTIRYRILEPGPVLLKLLHYGSPALEPLTTWLRSATLERLGDALGAEAPPASAPFDALCAKVLEDARPLRSEGIELTALSLQSISPEASRAPVSPG